ncbi:hypothetical protein PHYSODRAFT_250107 [Phytophthora sojae]|uniref:Uncharacterized protein n=1 Tax=Phytophthora sojae (strain P6497) TaxID=1094619 RepID=G5AAZ2_PHYSP|nr:hypothetical protein PHYSODRAFT_250107 [Phytophthora sojae]EGZ07771.1 hypothetical protein PHYSODRAFT_250107 [Phytophthora sojae]|eukprot:XP_009537337.1 hypothetical protein PHYSODRAFT_250107 [Phytophthora sojae]
MHSFKARLKPAEAANWMHSPLSGRLLQSLAQTAKLYAQCYAEIPPETSLRDSCASMTSSRWQYAIQNRGRKAIWFDPDADNKARSLECLVSHTSNIQENGAASRVELSSLGLQCALDLLLDLLPSEYEDAILAIDNYRTKLVDVCLDVGRVPYVYTGKKQRVVLSKHGATVAKDTIDEILSNLGGEMRIGDDNRAGIGRQLHRISVMRSKTDEVYGLPMRVGRALRNATCVLTDQQQHEPDRQQHGSWQRGQAEEQQQRWDRLLRLEREMAALRGELIGAARDPPQHRDRQDRADD